MRSIKEAFVGDTIYLEKAKVEPFKGFKAPRPMVNASERYTFLKFQMQKYRNR